MSKIIILLYPLIFICFLSAVETESDKYLNSIDVENKLGAKLSDDIQILTESSNFIELGSIFYQGTPLIMVMAYYKCPMLCSLVLNNQNLKVILHTFLLFNFLFLYT